MSDIRKKDEPTLAALPLSAIKGAIVGLIVSALFCLILSAIALTAAEPKALLTPLALVALISGALASGIVAGLTNRTSPALSGFVSGTLYVLILLALSLIFAADASAPVPPIISAVGYAGCALSALVGGILTRPKRINGSGKSPAALARKKIRTGR